MDRMRLGIYCFYDEDGEVDRYVTYLLAEIKRVVDKIIIVVNGALSEEGRCQFEKSSDNIYERQNIGFDGGAYKEILNLPQVLEMLPDYDELVLFNDTFFGPFYSLEAYFEQMGDRDVDLWGFGKWTNGYARELDIVVPDHIQSWFVVFRKKLLQSHDFYEFWDQMAVPCTYKDAVAFFESRITGFFSQRGYAWSTYVDEVHAPRINEPGQNYYLSPIDLIKDHRFPFLKYKHIMFPSMEGMGATLRFLNNILNYDTGMIWEHLIRKEKNGVLKAIDSYYDSHDSIYVFGNGNFGKMIIDFLLSRGKCISGIVVTNPSNADEIGISTLKLKENDGMIVAVGKKHINDVKNKLRDTYKESQLYYPDFYGDVS